MGVCCATNNNWPSMFKYLCLFSFAMGVVVFLIACASAPTSDRHAHIAVLVFGLT